MAAIGNFLAMVVWFIMFGVIIICVMAIAVLLLSGIVHLVAYLNKQTKLAEGRR